MRVEDRLHTAPCFGCAFRLVDALCAHTVAAMALVHPEQQNLERAAPHPRSYTRQQIIEDFRHYVPLLLDKPFAVPFASALQNGALPPAWETFRLRLVTERAALGLHDGNREFARILHLCLTHSVAEVGAALELAAASSRYSADAVRQLLRWADEPPPSREPLDPSRYPAYHLPQPRPDLAAYNRLLSSHAATGTANGTSSAPSATDRSKQG